MWPTTIAWVGYNKDDDDETIRSNLVRFGYVKCSEDRALCFFSLLICKRHQGDIFGGRIYLLKIELYVFFLVNLKKRVSR